MKTYFENAFKILKSIVLFGLGSSIYNFNIILLFNIKYKYCESIRELVLLLDDNLMNILQYFLSIKYIPVFISSL